MITDFEWMGPYHLIGMLIPIFLGTVLIVLRKSEVGKKHRKALGIAFAVLLVVVRGSRYIIDTAVGRFDFFDLFSLQICHIDLILLVICLIRPNRLLFQFVFLVGVPMGLAVALFPGSVHPEPGLSRAILFIMSHMMLVMGALYLCIAERFQPAPRTAAVIAAAGNAALVAVYAVNKLLGTNFLYIMFAPKGTVIESLDKMFGWPGYIYVMDAIALAAIALMLLLGMLLGCLTIEKGVPAGETGRRESS